MQSTLIIASDNKKSEEYAVGVCSKENIDPVDITRISSEESIGIAQIREVQKKIFLMPIRSSKKAVVFEKAEKITIEAQNALLKILEEPPINTLIFLLSDREDRFLPTVLSRCKIITLDGAVINSSEKEEYVEILNKIPSMTISEKLKLAQDVTKNNEQIATFLTGLIVAARAKMLTDYVFVDHIIKINKAYETSMKTNVNSRFLLENLLIQL